MFDEHDALVEALAQALRNRGLTCATAESCTGGLVGAMLTAVPGSSDWYVGGVISYANAVMQGLLGVRRDDLERVGAVSEPVVRSMALGACAATGAQVAMSTSGVAGPGGGSAEKPVGTVWFGLATPDWTSAEKQLFDGDRESVREQTVSHAIKLLREGLRDF